MHRKAAQHRGYPSRRGFGHIALTESPVKLRATSDANYPCLIRQCGVKIGHKFPRRPKERTATPWLPLRPRSDIGDLG